MMATDGLKARENKLAVFENVVPKKKTKRRFFGKDIEDNLSSSESDLVIDERDEQPKRKARKKALRLKEEPLNIHCKWLKCKLTFTDYDKLIFHLRDHVHQKYKNNKKKFVCLWAKCSCSVTSYLYLMQHVIYHGYFSRLENIGENIIERDNLPACTQDYQLDIPLNEGGYTCEWDDCNANFVTIYDFIQHMPLHIKNNPTCCKGNEIIHCQWKNCTTKWKTQYLLADHLRTHTKEKLVACKHCGKSFAARTKFSDHRRRQLPINLQGYQCSQCSKLFPSERLLRDHMRFHINHYKCSMCDMTCTKPSSLALHIRHRHLDDRPYKCNLCEHACVTKQNLEYHLITHCAEKLLACDECDFKCRSMPGLDRHYQKVHYQDWEQTYECHCCQKLFKRGAFLTQHLMRAHDFHWPSGHSRFRYKEDPDHIYRLQTVRYESLEVTEQILKNTDNIRPPAPTSFKYNLRKRTRGKDDRGPEYAVGIDIDKSGSVGEQSSLVSTKDNQTKDILITIDDVDEHGNILRTEVIHANQIFCEAESTVEGTVLKCDEGERTLIAAGNIIGASSNFLEAINDGEVGKPVDQISTVDVSDNVKGRDVLQAAILETGILDEEWLEIKNGRGDIAEAKHETDVDG